MTRVPLYSWKKVPFIRILIPFIGGIMVQEYLHVAVSFISAGLVCFITAFLLFGLLPVSIRFKFQSLAGIQLFLIIALTGCWCTWQHDSRNHAAWYGNNYQESDWLLVTINEPPVEKSKSWKAEATVNLILRDSRAIPCDGKLILYFSKSPSTEKIQYGDRILFKRKLESIKNSGNPGAFDYKRYATFQQLFHTVFLKPSDFVALIDKQTNPVNELIFYLQKNILRVLRHHITGSAESGIAEALLIGYKEDLDKDLVQAYSNTGVVHIIAISGLHIGLIYVMLVWLFARLPLVKRLKWLQLPLILISLWLFTLLTGASASVLRSTVMFTFIIIGQHAGKKTSIYNSLAVSAFLLLLYNPFFLWDAGFLLSYLAVLGIVAFQKPIYNWFYVSNKWIDKVWQMIAVSLAAQLFTFPICLYYFHQFPNYFLITNIIAVPLSSLILFAEIVLIALSEVWFIGYLLAKITTWLLWLMNKIILTVNALPFALFEGIHFTVVATWLLYAVVISLCYWLITKEKMLCYLFLASLLCLQLVLAEDKWQAVKQHGLIIYNIPQHQALDFIEGNAYCFVGDSILKKRGGLQNLAIKPGRIAMQLEREMNLPDFKIERHFFFFHNKRILLVDSALAYQDGGNKIKVDVIILSKNAKISVTALANVFNCKQYVLDGSNSLWKIDKWKKECEELHLRCHAVSEQGAFISDIGE